MKRLEQRIDQLERTAWTPLDKEIQSLMMALLDMGMSQSDLERIVRETIGK